MIERHLLDGRADEDLQHDTFSTWDVSTHGPTPRPDWVVTDLSAHDTELGILKTGKEADVHLVERTAPDGTSCLLAAKRYRTAEHRQFHRDSGYTEGRRVRRSRETRAMARRTEFGRELLAGQWSSAEFTALSRLWSDGAPVPYPVQLLGTEVMLEFIGSPTGEAAPRLAAWRGTRDEARDLWEQLRDAMSLLARNGWAHGDLSAYNLLVHEGRLVMIDLPQVVDVVANPQGVEFLARDVRNVGAWFERHGVDVDVDLLIGDLAADAFGA
ncbi:serine protein kinase RIO [Jatrophihabitans sp. YIM 134969]